jgi:uncharacterized protein
MSETTPSRPAGLPSSQPFHVMAKPSGPACNLKCDYCFYLEKEALFPAAQRRRMSDETLEAYVVNTLRSSPAGQPVMFTWQGGEPTLLGIAFFERAVALQKKYGDSRRIGNSLQTNGVLIDDDWAKFLADNKFLVGLSLDGPAEFHDSYRRDNAGRPTHARVMTALERLQRHKVDVNILACVDARTSKHPDEVYRFFKASGVDYIQFIPIVERHPSTRYAEMGLVLDGPPPLSPEIGTNMVTDWSVAATDWGRFLTAVFEDWRRHDVGSVYVMNFEWSLAAYMNQPGVVCVYQENCGRALIAEHNGDVFSCDHFAYPAYRLGNLHSANLADMVDSVQQKDFGRAKSKHLPGQCRSCKYLRGCWGGCPKHRFLPTADGEPGLNYLCAGHLLYLRHIEPYIKLMADLIRRGRAPRDMMGMDIQIVRPSSSSCTR